jgi:hypothetical protein
VDGCGCLRAAFLRGVRHLIWFRMQLSVMNLVTIRHARMIPVFLHALFRHFGDFVGGGCGRIGRVGDTGCEYRRGHHGGREQNGRDFPVHGLVPLGHWLIEDWPKTIMRLRVSHLM